MRVAFIMRGVACAAVLASALLLPRAAHAAKFANQFLEFELPPGWTCAKEAGDWFCDNADAGKKRDAVIVFAAKLKGPGDTLDAYRAYLNAPRKYSQGGKTLISESQYVRDKAVNGHIWIDSRHLNSEVPGFYTRYLATVEQDIGVLITWSVDKKKYAEYEGFFDKLLASMKVFRHQGAPAPVAGGNILANNGISSNGVFGSVDPNTGSATEGTIKKHLTSKGGGGALGLILLLAAGGGFIFWRKKRAAGG